MPEEHPGDDQEHRDQYSSAVKHVPAKAGHSNTAAFGNRPHHEIRAISNVGICPHEDRAEADGLEHLVRDADDVGAEVLSLRQRQERNIRRSVVEKRRERPCCPEELPRMLEPELAASAAE